MLDELVVTGYQSISRERVTGAFAVVDPNDLKGRLQTDIMGRLEGQIPGLVQQGDGNFLIRGVSTLKGESKPLIVVDGMPFVGDLKSINPATVTKVTVLKDAAAASIYGARAANGVIVINTLEGSTDGKVHISYDGSVLFTQKPNHRSLNFMTTSELIDTQVDAFGLVTTTLSELNPRYGVNEVELLLYQEREGTITTEQLNTQLARLRNLDNRQQIADFYLRTGVLHQHNLALSGGNDKHNYVASVNYLGDTPTSRFQHSRAFGFTLRNSMQFLPWLSADLGVAGNFDSSTSDIGVESYNGYLRNYPSTMLYDADGNLGT